MSDKPSQTVWKYPLELTDKPQRIAVTVGARLVHAAWFQGQPTVWYLVEPARPHGDRWVQIAATGQVMPVHDERRIQDAATGQVMPVHDEAVHMRTLIQDDTVVWHIFELVNR